MSRPNVGSEQLCMMKISGKKIIQFQAAVPGYKPKASVKS
ncbi:predicted protein [Botrytis cinerea T4]|uniref:Uncharacterized protein n=1 Tax=Botryotinia fuckeliana (strain T4) TaxID=999810 RepID=G2XRM7_BOTF4|nr:predicted protein [Botrytis cinerea T4]